MRDKVNFLNHHTFETDVFEWKKFNGNSILFLDIDGVLNNPTTYFKMNPIYREYPLNYEKHLIQRLQKIIDEFPRMYICISSSNRYGQSNNYLEKLLISYGLINFNFLGATPILDLELNNVSRTRGLEVQYVLDYYKPQNYVIIDDMMDFLENQIGNFVRIDGSIGLQEQDVRSVFKILNK